MNVMFVANKFLSLSLPPRPATPWAQEHAYLEELPLVGRRPQPADVLEGEPADAGGLDGGQVRAVSRLTSVRVVAVH